MSLIAKYHNNDVTLDMTLKLFVGQVPKNFEEPDLKPYFEKYGPLVNIKICRDRDSKTHKGCAFVTFANLDDAENAMHEMHDRIALPGAKKEMQIKAVHNDDNKKFDKRLFVGMISKTLNGDELKAMFTKFGEVIDCNILTSMINGEKTSRGCGFVKFAKASSCLQAIKDMHQSQTMEGCNSPIVVKYADSPADKMKRNASGFDEREDSKRNHYRTGAGMQQAPFGGGNHYGNQHGGGYPIAPPPPQQPHQNRNQYGGGNNATATALISAFTPLLATVAEQNNPGTTRMLVESIKIALNALHHENTTSAQAAMVSIASSLSVAVANNLNKKTASNFDHQGAQSGGMFGNSSEFYNPAASANNNSHNMNSPGFGSGMNNYYSTTPPGVQQYSNRPN